MLSLLYLKPRITWCIAALAIMIAGSVCAGSGTEGSGIGEWNAHVQATYIWQQKDAFYATYNGFNSLSPQREQSYSFTATAFLGIRPWSGGELYFDPEVSRGQPLSNLTGLGGFSNGEMARTNGPDFKLYRARLYLHQTWNLGGDFQSVADEPDQLAANVTHHRISLTVGNISLLDVFDPCNYSHDPRNSFLNWALITYGAYDFAADARGYTWAAIAELDEDDWAFRIARAMLPKLPNGLQLDSRIFQHYGDQLEIEHRHHWRGHDGAVRLLAYHDRAAMARYEDALRLAETMHATPDINAVRTHAQDKTGVGMSVEQALGDSSGIFARAMWADGKTETEAYATIDRSLAAGVVLAGGSWHRARDATGFAYAWNGLSVGNRRYLAAGGRGFFIGDGRLNYAAERIGEVYYDLHLFRGVSITADLQHITNPAYNRDRGPVTVVATRLHFEM